MSFDQFLKLILFGFILLFWLGLDLGLGLGVRVGVGFVLVT
jgi:hypothetical protein